MHDQLSLPGFEAMPEAAREPEPALADLLDNLAARASGASALVAEEIATPLRPMLAVAGERGLCLLEFLDRRAITTELGALRLRHGLPIVRGANRHLDRVRSELEAYFRGGLRSFTVPLDLGGTPFQRRVWDRLLAIPFGETVTYSEVARHVGKLETVRAVGQANGKNPVAIVVPCHRVVGADGSLQGYGGGLWRKRWLLRHESAARRARH